MSLLTISYSIFLLSVLLFYLFSHYKYMLLLNTILFIPSSLFILNSVIKDVKYSLIQEQQNHLKEEKRRYDISVIYKDKTKEEYKNIKQYYVGNAYLSIILPNGKEIEIYNADIKIVEK